MIKEWWGCRSLVKTKKLEVDTKHTILDYVHSSKKAFKPSADNTRRNFAQMREQTREWEKAPSTPENIPFPRFIQLPPPGLMDEHLGQYQEEVDEEVLGLCGSPVQETQVL